MEEVVGLLGLSTSANPNDVKMAETSLSMKESLSGFVETLLMIITKVEFEMHIRQVGCIYIKNLVKRKWDLEWEHGGMNKQDRDVIKKNIVNIYMNSPEIIQSQVGEMLLFISVRDFPTYWNDLLVDIIKFLPDEKMDLLHNNGMFMDNDLNALVGKLRQYECTLSMMKLVLDKYQYAESSNKILLELKDILKLVCDPMYKMFVFSSQCLIRRLPVIQEINCKLLIMKICLLSCQIFYILHCCDIPEFFEDRIGPFMESFNDILEIDTNMGLVDTEEQLILCLNIKSQICDNLRIYSDRYQEPFDIYSRKSLSTVAILLTRLVSHDQKSLENTELSNSISSLIDEGLRLIGSLAATQWSDNAFLDTGVLDHLVEKILIPCTFLDLSDLSLIEDTPKDFIYKYLWDINDVCDSTSKRSAALECIKNLGKFYYTKLSGLLSNLIINLLNNITSENCPFFEWEEFNEKNGQYCKYRISKADIMREASVFLFICLSVRSFSRLNGVTQLEHEIDLVGFYERYIKNYTNTPLMRCCALKYLIVFKGHFNNVSSMDILQQSYTWLSNSISIIEEMMIILAFEKIITQKNTTNVGNSQNEFEKKINNSQCGDINLVNGELVNSGTSFPNSSNINNIDYGFKLPLNETCNLCFQILNNVLYPMLKKACQVKDKKVHLAESEFVPRCMTRLLSYIGKSGGEYINNIAPTIIDCTKLAIENPKNPLFNHYLFELLGVCIKYSIDCEKLDQFLLPLLIGILERNITDFIPYSLQLLALRLDTLINQNQLYDKLFIHLIDPKIWHGTISVIPGIIRLCSSFFRRYNFFENTISTHIKQIFERFQFCLGHRRLQSSISFEFLRDIVRYLPYQWYSQYLTALSSLLLTRSQEWNRVGDHQMIIQVVSAFSIIIIKKPFDEFQETYFMNVLETLQTGLSTLFFNKVVFPNLSKATLCPSLRYTIFISILKLIFELKFEQTKHQDFIFEAFKSIYFLYNSISACSDDTYQRRSNNSCNKGDNINVNNDHNNVNIDNSHMSCNIHSKSGNHRQDASNLSNYSLYAHDNTVNYSESNTSFNYMMNQNSFIQDEYEINYHRLAVASSSNLNNSYPNHKEIINIINLNRNNFDNSDINNTNIINNGSNTSASTFLKYIHKLDHIKLIKTVFLPYINDLNNHFINDQDIYRFILTISK